MAYEVPPIVPGDGPAPAPASTGSGDWWSDIGDIFKNSDGSSTGAGTLLTLLGGIGGAQGWFDSDQERVGYQGEIPRYDAIREAVPNTNDPNRRPGSNGQRYFTDTVFAQHPETPVPTVDQAGDTTGDQASDLTPPVQPTPEQAKASDFFTTLADNAALIRSRGGDVQQTANDWVQYVKDQNGVNNAPSASEFFNTLAQNAELIKSRGDDPQRVAEQWVQYVKDRTAQNNMAAGGLATLDKGYYMGGSTDGMADQIPASLGGQQPAALSDGEFVVPADVVSHMGNGNSQAGAKQLYEMMERIRKARTGMSKQAKQVDPKQYMPG